MAKKFFYTLFLALLAFFCFPIEVVRTSYSWGVLPFRYGTGSPFMFNLRVFAGAFVRVWND